MKKKLLLLALAFLANSLTYLYSQDCEPTIISKDGTIEYFGGKIRDGVAILTDDKSAYSFYVVQVDKGEKGTFAVVSFFESVENRQEYNNAINDYLNQQKLNNSYLEIYVNDKKITIASKSCSASPKSTLGSIYGYNVSFEGKITKEQIKLLQNFEIKKFKFTIGGKPYERVFKRSTKITRHLKSIINCVKIENVVENTEEKIKAAEKLKKTKENVELKVISTDCPKPKMENYRKVLSSAFSEDFEDCPVVIEAEYLKDGYMKNWLKPKELENMFFFQCVKINGNTKKAELTNEEIGEFFVIEKDKADIIFDLQKGDKLYLTGVTHTQIYYGKKLSLFFVVSKIEKQIN